MLKWNWSSLKCHQVGEHLIRFVGLTWWRLHLEREGVTTDEVTNFWSVNANVDEAPLLPVQQEDLTEQSDRVGSTKHFTTDYHLGCYLLIKRLGPTGYAFRGQFGFRALAQEHFHTLNAGVRGLNHSSSDWWMTLPSEPWAFLVWNATAGK